MRVNLTAKELATMVGGSITSDPSFMVERVTSLSSAGPHDLAVVMPRGDTSVFDEISNEEVLRSKAGLILSPKPLDRRRAYLVVKDPVAALQILHQELSHKGFLDENNQRQAVISHTAVLGNNVDVGPCAVIEDGTKIGAFSRIGSQVFIGRNCVIGAHVVIKPGVTVLGEAIIGDYTIIHPGTVVGSDGFGYQVNADGMRKIPHIGRVRVGSYVEIGANVSIDRALFDETVIEDGVKIDNNVHIAHGVHIGASTAILALTGIAGSAKIGRGCQIGGQVGIKNHIIVGNGAKIVSQSAVLKNVEAGVTVAGSPAIPIAKWRRVVAITAKLPQLVQKMSQLIASTERNKKRSFLWRFFSNR